MSGFRCQFRKGSLMKGSMPEIVQYGPSSRFECFTASKVLSTDTHLDNLINHSCECITVRSGMHMSHSHSNSTRISSKS